MDTIRSAWEKFEVTPDEVVRDEGDVPVVSELKRRRGRGSGVEVGVRVFSVYSFREGKVRTRESRLLSNAGTAPPRGHSMSRTSFALTGAPDRALASAVVDAGASVELVGRTSSEEAIGAATTV
jgi:hypothetical protein